MSLSDSLRRFAARALHSRPDVSACLEDGAIRMYWWNEVQNLGDAIAPLIVEKLSGRRVVHRDKRERCKLVSCGSVISKAREGDFVWGSGSLDPDARMRSANVRVTAVRGPLTRKLLLAQGVECPEVYGDPGCLAPLLFPKTDCQRDIPLGVIPHYTEKSLFADFDPQVAVLDIQAPPGEFFAALFRCQRVASSSLHGIIFAENYGIPASWLTISESVRGGGHKFRDYYLGTGREPAEPLALAQIAREPDWTPPVADNASALLASFPFGPRGKS